MMDVGELEEGVGALFIILCCVSSMCFSRVTMDIRLP
jgi:hypothetical protein